MAIELNLYTRKKRRKVKNPKLELQCLRIEMSQLQYRHNQLVKAILALSQNRTVKTSLSRSGENIPTETELDFINGCLGNTTDDNLLTIEDEIEDLLGG
jgi:hypothetical protein